MKTSVPLIRRFTKIVATDLEDLIAIWNSTGALDSRLAVLEQGLCQPLGDAAFPPSVFPLGRASSGARRLALATTSPWRASKSMPVRMAEDWRR